METPTQNQTILSETEGQDLLQFEQIRQNLFQMPPERPGNHVFRAFQSLMARQDDGAFNAEMWWVVDRQYRPKLERGATPLVVRGMRVHGWTENYARRVLFGYRQFLSLKRAMQDWEGRILEPSKDIHRLWQQHILDVTNYSYDCVLLCGKMIEHRPDDETLLEERQQRRWNTKQVLENVFSDIDIEVWHSILTTGPLHLAELKDIEENFDQEEDVIILTKNGEHTEKAGKVTNPMVESQSPRRNDNPRKTVMTQQERRERFRRRVAAKSPQKSRQKSPSRSSNRSSRAQQPQEDSYVQAQSDMVPALENTCRPLSPSTIRSSRYQSPLRSPGIPRPSTPGAERPYGDSTLSPNPPPRLHRLVEESRVDVPTPRTAKTAEDTSRLEYEIETDWGVVKSFELVPEHPVEEEDDIEQDPITRRRFSFEQSDYETPDRLIVSPPTYLRGRYKSPSGRMIRDLSPSFMESFPQCSEKEVFPYGQPPVDSDAKVAFESTPVSMGTTIPSSKTPKSDRKTMTIHFRNVQTMEVIPTRVRSTMKLGRMFQAYASSQNLPLAYLHFFWHGKVVRSTDTPTILGLSDHDKIDVWNSLTAAVSTRQGSPRE
jgi:hypothetical protein